MLQTIFYFCREMVEEKEFIVYGSEKKPSDKFFSVIQKS